MLPPDTPHYFIEIRQSHWTRRFQIRFGKLHDIKRFSWYKKFLFGSKADFYAALQQDLEQQNTTTQREVLLFFHGMWGDSRPFMAASIQDMEHAFMQQQATKIGLTISVIWHAYRPDYLRSHRKCVLLAQHLKTDFEQLTHFLGQHQRQPHLLCHSMGNQLFAQLFPFLKQKNDELPFFQQIILTAADLRNTVFEPNQPLAQLPAWAKKIHVYFRKNDRPILASGMMHRNKRLGWGGLLHPINGIMEIDTTDISDETDVHARANRHLYYHASPRILRDEIAVLNGRESTEIEGRILEKANTFRLIPFENG